MKIYRSESNRVFVLFLMISVWIVLIGGTLIKTQVLNYKKYLSKIKAQKTRFLDLHPKRGTIYDRNGEILAISIKAKSAFLSNKDISDSLRLFGKIARVVRIGKNSRKKIRTRIRHGDKFIWIKRKLADSEYEKLRIIKKSSNNKSILDFIEEYKRLYPQKELACHVLGGVGIDEQGLSGIEYELDPFISGSGGKVKVELDARRRIFKVDYLNQPTPGKDIYLTIDSSLQFFVERELKKKIKELRAESGTVIIMDSQTGSILALASYPGYEPNEISRTSLKKRRNLAVSFSYEPGSTFKVILAAAALENKVCYPQQVFDCYRGVFQIRDRKIFDVKPFGKLSFADILVYSSNIGAAKIGLRLGKKRFFKNIKDFGFGEKMGINLHAEEKGILHPLNKWNEVSVAFISEGYGIAVTPLQMLRAFNVIASGGFLMQPYVVGRLADVTLNSRKDIRVLSASTVHRISSIMTDVVNRGTGKNARIEGIDIAGKTGTAKKLKNGKYEKIYVSSFGGFFPVQNPRITMFVVVDEPKGVYYGGDVAAPLFKSIVEKLMVYLNIFPELDNRNEIRL